MDMNCAKHWVLAIAAWAITAATHADPLIYDDALQNGSQNQSWAAVDSNHNTTKHSGTQSIGQGATRQYTLAGPSTNTVTYAASTFVHPGALDSRGELDFVKAKIQAKAYPWRAEFDRLVASSYATRTPHGKTTINSSNGDAELSRDDAIASYTQALLWYYSGNAIYANRSIAILNSWTKLQSFTAGSDQDKLAVRTGFSASRRRNRLASRRGCVHGQYAALHRGAGIDGDPVPYRIDARHVGQRRPLRQPFRILGGGLQPLP